MIKLKRAQDDPGITLFNEDEARRAHTLIEMINCKEIHLYPPLALPGHQAHDGTTSYFFPLLFGHIRIFISSPIEYAEFRAMHVACHGLTPDEEMWMQAAARV